MNILLTLKSKLEMALINWIISEREPKLFEIFGRLTRAFKTFIKNFKRELELKDYYEVAKKQWYENYEPEKRHPYQINSIQEGYLQFKEASTKNIN